jgi:arginyl-tRNA synthetase
MDLSVADLKRNYSRLNVDFDWWKGESDVQDLIEPMVEKMKADGYAYLDDGALIVDVSEEDDKKEIPPCMILKSDGSALYATTDLATLLDRRDWHPDKVVYIVDKRQGLHFTQVFRCAKKTGVSPEETELDFRGFGTMNGPDGQPYKTREGGVMRLSALIDEINSYMVDRVRENETVAAEDAEETARIIGLAALKYGDLSNQASKDYVFSLERFASSDGNTGPYLLYTIVRIKSILDKYDGVCGTDMNAPGTPSERELMLSLVRFPDAFADAADQMAPHKVCAYLYDLANHFNGFYRDVKILAEPDPDRKAGYIALLKLTLRVLEQGIDLLGFEAPDRM